MKYEGNFIHEWRICWSIRLMDNYLCPAERNTILNAIKQEVNDNGDILKTKKKYLIH